MLIGIPKEIKVRENRVGVVPGGVRALIAAGHRVQIQKGAGVGAGITDDQYRDAGAKIVDTSDTIWDTSEMVMKVKEPIAEEYPKMRPGLLLYTFLHLAAERKLTQALLERKVTGVAYETIELDNHSLPLLTPMSEVAGRMAVQVGAKCLEKHSGGKGILLGGVPGVRRGHVVVVGGGAAGVNAAKMAVGLGAQVTILDINQARLAYLDDVFGNTVTTLMSNVENIERSVASADLVVGAVLLTGAKAPILVTREMVRSMEKGSAIVDISIDQGGSIETIRATTHDDPIYEAEGVIHYGVTNIPGAVPMTSTYALTNMTLPFALQLASGPLDKVLTANKPLARGLNTYQGHVTHKAVAEALAMEYRPYPG